MRWQFKLWRERSKGLRRFKEAQNALAPPYRVDTVYDIALREIKSGHKVSCWMWFIFPQGKGLGQSYYSHLYALSPREARRYLKDPVLGDRLLECMNAVIEQLDQGLSLEGLLGEVDAMKFRSCVDLFMEAAPLSFRRIKDQVDDAPVSHYVRAVQDRG